MPEEILDFGTEPENSSLKIKKEKDHVNPYDIFRLAKGILIVATIIYATLALIRIFYKGDNCNNEGIKEVWEYSKVFLNSIVSLVLGLYFGAKQEAKSKSS
jgi:hypothetical protein